MKISVPNEKLIFLPIFEEHLLMTHTRTELWIRNIRVLEI